MSIRIEKVFGLFFSFSGSLCSGKIQRKPQKNMDLNVENRRKKKE